MPVYTVHAPVTNGAGIAAADRFAFVHDGFHFWAAVFGPLWLVWHRLWLATIGWIILALAINVGLARLGAGGTAIFWVDVLLALLMGFEASSIRRWTLSRGNWRQFDIVVARNWEAAVDRGAPPPTRDTPGQAFSRPPPLPRNEIIGLFPEPGASR
jgi:hypothetical protein